MPYIGRDLNRGNYLKLDDISSSFDGNKKTFNLTSGGTAFIPGSSLSILVSVGGVILEPETAYQINNSEITFTTAPSGSDNFFCIVLGVALGVNTVADGTVNGAQVAKPFNYDDYFHLDSTNNRVGINSSIPSVALDVNGTVKSSVFKGPIHNTSGLSTFHDLRVNNNLTVEGTTTTLNTDLIDVDRIEIGANSDSDTAIVGIQSGSADIVNLFDGASQVVTVDDTGNVGLGSAIPSDKLDVHGDIIAYESSSGSVRLVHDGNIELTNNNGAIIDFKTSGSEDFDCRIRQMSDGLQFMTGGNGSTDEAVRITSGGLVGIGTTNPDAKLEVHNGSNIEVLRLRDTHHNKYLTIRGGGSPNRMIIDSYEDDGSSGADIDFASNGSTKVRIKSDGEILMGTTTDRPIAGQGFDSGNGWSGSLQIEKLNPNELNNTGCPMVAITAWNGANEKYTGGLSFNRSASNTQGTHSAVNASKQLGNISFNGSDGTNFICGAEIFAIPEEAFATNDGPTALVFGTTPNGTTVKTPQERLRIGSTGNTTIATEGDTVADSFSLKVGQANENSNSGSGPHYGLLVNQLGARYHLNVGVYSEVLGTNGLFSGTTFEGMTKMRSIGVVGISTVSSEAYQKGIGVYGKVLLNNYNYNDVYGVKGLARPGTDGFSANNTALSYAGYGGHFVAHGNGQSIGVYADAYLDGSPGANQEAIPLKVASNGTELVRITSGGSILIDTKVTTEASADGNDLIIGSTSDTQKGISIVGSTTNGVGNIFFTDGASYKNQGIIQYRHADDSMRFTTNQYERLRITGIGSVGIGTHDPQKLLELEHVANRKLQFSYDDNLITIKGANNNGNPETIRLIGGDSIRFHTGANGSGDEGLRIDSAGRIQIGSFINASYNSFDGPGRLNIQNNSPDGTVDFTQGIVFTDNTNDTGTWTHAGIVCTGSSGYRGNIVFGTDDDGTSNNLATNITEKMRIKSDGHVGIGTSNPTGKIHISSDANTILGRFDSNNKRCIDLVSNDASGAAEIRGYKNTGSGTHEQTFMLDAGGVSYFNGGNVGINSSIPAAKLDVAGGFQVTDSDGNINLSLTSSYFDVRQSLSTWTATTTTTTPIIRWKWKSGVGDHLYFSSGGNTPPADQMAMILSDQHGFKVGRSGWDDDNNTDLATGKEYFRVNIDGKIGVKNESPSTRVDFAYDSDTNSNAFMQFKGPHNKSGEMLHKYIHNGNSGNSQVVNLLEVTSWQSTNSRIFGVVKVMAVHPLSNHGNQHEGWFFKDDAGDGSTGAMGMVHNKGGSVGSLDWDGDTLRYNTPASSYLNMHVSVEYHIYDGGTVVFDTDSKSF